MGRDARRPRISVSDHEHPHADICLVLEGTYPYVAGGVSTWTHDLIRGLPEFKFQILTLMPPGADHQHRYEVPYNVIDISTVTLQELSLYQNFLHVRIF